MGQIISSLFSGFGITDVIDIAIVSFLIYKLLGFIRSTRAEQLAKGLAVVVVAAFLSKILNLYIVNWIFTGILNVGIIAVVVLFQPELRRGLEFLGRGKFTRQFSLRQEEISGNVDAIITAVEYFAARKEGAIIVIERETALQDIADTGTIVDAKLSTPLLENIFYKGSPLHDGACIIRSDRILAAGCVLPLTQNQNLSKDLGTRHRAGLGISEISDAVAIIISEETGIISMASDGRLSRFLDIKSIEKQLFNMYISDQPDEDRLLVKLRNLLRRKDNESEAD
ncbi:MAG: diadenylate cyclase CdaA [Firmicutes bacterium]|nr:diadenylate cyclase CdaA [Bacillota bacterium]